MANMISRENLSGLIPEPITREIIQGVTESSAVLRMGRKLPNMTSKTQTLNVLDSLPTAYFVNGDNGTKKLTNMAWDKKKIYAEEIAVIIPIPEAVLDDADYDIWGEVKPRLAEAFGRVIDSAILFGQNKPDTWRKSIVETAEEAGNVVSRSADMYLDIFGVGGALAKIEESGFDASGIMASVKSKARLRALRDDNKQPIFKTSLQDGTKYDLEGIALDFPMNGAFDDDEAEMIFGDFSELCYAIRQDITYKVFTEGVVQNPQTGEILYNLMQNDMVALRAVMRLGWEIPNPINAFNADLEHPCPFSVYRADRLSLTGAADIATSTDLLGKYVTDLQEDIRISGNTIYGKLKYVTGYTGFSGDADEQKGNFIALHFTAKTGSTISIRLLNGNQDWQTLDSDGIAILQVGNGAAYYDQAIEVKAVNGTDTTIRHYSLAMLECENG